MPASATASAPCTVGNFGPGFDALSLALARRGDAVTLTPADADEIRVTGPGADEVPRAWAQNCATAALDHLRAATGLRQPLRVEVDKGMPPGSGLGSSASSAAAAVRAFARLFPQARVGALLALEAAAAGEAAASPGHRDDVAAALFGGLVVVGPAPTDVRVVPVPSGARFAVARPEVRLETRRMRALVPAELPRADVVNNLAAVARIVDAGWRGDVAALGRAVDADRVAQPRRGPHVPGFAEARAAALAAGASGACISGSGPSTLAVCAAGREETVLAAMLGAYRKLDIAAEGFTCGANEEVDDAIPLP